MISSKDLSSIKKVFKESAQILFNRVNVQHRMLNENNQVFNLGICMFCGSVLTIL